MNSQPIHILQWGMTTGLGGIETFIMNVYRHMDRTKVQFDFLQDRNDGPLQFEDEIRDMGGTVYRELVPQRDSLIRSRTCLLKFFRQHPEIVGVHMHANFPYALPLKYAQRAGIGLRVLHSHNIEEYQHHENPLRALLWDMRGRSIAKDIDRYPTHYFACSDLAANFMFPDKPYTWVRNGIDSARFAYNPAVRKRLREELGIAEHTSVIGFCGGLRPQKNPMFLLSMFERYHAIHPDSVLILVGDGLLREDIERNVTEMNLEGCVRLLGQRADAAELYQAMDAFVLPSVAEGLGIVYIEAQCAGLPCLGSAGVVPESARVCDLMHFERLESGPETWAERLNDMLENASERKDRTSEVQAKGYEMSDVAASLQEFYIRNAGRS